MRVEPTAASSQWLRGVLELCLLAVVEREPAYGYEMTRRLTDAGLAVVADGSIYPALARLERDGSVASYRVPGEGGPPRKYYRITAAGRVSLTRGRADWAAFSHGVDETLTAGKVKR
jgi:PadR family transcriptional regulator, regulatory protein PadR